MERAISSVNVDDTTNVWNHVRTRNLSIKSTWMPRPRIIIRAIEKYRGGRGGGVGGSCRQYRRCKYLTKIRRRLSFSPALLVPRVSTAVRSRKSVRCLRNYLPPRSFDDSIGNFRRMKGAFPFSIFFFPPFLSLSVLFPPLFSFPFVFFFLSGETWDWIREEFRKIDRRYVCRFLDRADIYRRGNINRASVPSSRVTQFRRE